MTITQNSREYSADEDAYLWTVARRSPIELKLEEPAMRHLLETGMLKVEHDWPTLTGRGKHYLESRATALWSEIMKNDA